MTEEREFRTLLCDHAGAVAMVTLHRPEALNAIDRAMLDDLAEVFAQLSSDPEVRVILLTGSGERAFAAGADIRELLGTDSASGEAISARGQEVFAQIEHCGKPVIACIHGAALGGGCELALACTFRLASATAKLGLPEARLGLIPGFGGIQRLVRLIGRGTALRVILSAQILDAAEALRVGLVEEVIPSPELMKRAGELAETIAGMAPLALTGVLEAAAREEALSVEEGFRAEREIFGRLCGTADKHEGLTAFIDKRKAAWLGK